MVFFPSNTMQVLNKSRHIILQDSYLMVTFHLLEELEETIIKKQQTPPPPPPPPPKKKKKKKKKKTVINLLLRLCLPRLRNFSIIVSNVEDLVQRLFSTQFLFFFLNVFYLAMLQCFCNLATFAIVSSI